jgi:Xaa-Pro aminopeptidase
VSTNVQEPAVAGIRRSEMGERAARAREAMASAGLEAALVVGRGGGPFERHGNLQWLTGHYSTFPTIPDQPGYWRMRGHAAALLTHDRLVLLTDVAVDADAVSADDVRTTPDLPTAIADAVRAHAPDGRIGLVGGDVLTAPQLADLDAEMRRPLEPVGELLAPLRRVKSPAEQDLLRAAAAVGRAAIGAGLEAAVEGATEQLVAAEAARVAVSHGAAVVNIFTDVGGPGRGPRARRFPSFADAEPIRAGDLVTLDMSAALDGYWFDFCRTVVVGEDRHGGAAAIAAARRLVDVVVAGLVAGSTVREAIAPALELPGVRERLAEGSFGAFGHGLGLGFEDPWLTVDDPTPLVAGMSIAVEASARRGDLVAGHEENVLVTDGAPEVTTRASAEAATTDAEMAT